MYQVLEFNPYLYPYQSYIERRMALYRQTRQWLVPDGEKLSSIANMHEYYGFHRADGGWYYREWAPSAERLNLIGDFNRWNKRSHPLHRLGDGTWEIFLPGEDALWDGCNVKVVVQTSYDRKERLPIFTRYATQDPDSLVWCTTIRCEEDFVWTDEGFKGEDNLFIYEAHTGMAQEDEKVSSYREFTEKILPRIKKAGYNTLQLMAVMEHPYYGSFGYQVSNFFAPSSRFGTPNDLKDLINTAHKMGIRVLLDLVHSHAVKNHAEGINMFDGTVWQFFYDGMKGEHPAWDTKCFDYGREGVLRFLLSNLKYWLTEYHFDGFRFDGITSMIYHDHGLGVSFDSPEKYFSDNTHEEAIAYLQLANELIREIKPDAITVAEDMSGMPGMCLPIEEGGIGFDYRLGMGLPDLWIRMASEKNPLKWNVGKMWHEMILRRKGEKTIAYVESHDQALVGDQTLIFRLAQAGMYTDMSAEIHNREIDRAIAMHKMTKLMTASAGGEGYLNFMGNEFGHPEWIDFPREDNGLSYHYCRRQWSLQDNPFLKYKRLGDFDRDMVCLLKNSGIYEQFLPDQMYYNETQKVIVFYRNGYLFAFNFNPVHTYSKISVPIYGAPDYRVVLSSDEEKYGGFGRTIQTLCKPYMQDGTAHIDLTLPAQTAIVLKAE